MAIEPVRRASRGLPISRYIGLRFIRLGSVTTHPDIAPSPGEQNRKALEMTLRFSVADMTVHRIVELDCRFMPALEMLPGLTPEVLAESREWLRPSSLDHDDVFK